MRTLLPLLFLAPLSVDAQSLVDQLPHSRTALLEDFTAINCGNCPPSHALAATIVADHPGEVVLVGIHAGGLAVPGPGQPDFQTSWGTEKHVFYNIAAWPKGVINGMPYNGLIILPFSSWVAAVDSALSLPSPVNLGLNSTFDPLTRELTVQVELYYTADGLGGNDRITVLLKEDHIIGWQSAGSATYDHVNVLRAFLTDTWGDEVTTTDMGTSVLRTYTMTVPAEFNADNCRVAAFVGEYQGEVYMAEQVEAVSTSTAGILDQGTLFDRLALYPQPATDRVTIALHPSMHGSRIGIFDIAGRCMQEGRIEGNASSVPLDVSAWPEGTYVCRVVHDHGVAAGKFQVIR